MKIKSEKRINAKMVLKDYFHKIKLNWKSKFVKTVNFGYVDVGDKLFW